MAARVDGGWRLDGTAPWYTGWGLSDIALVAGATPDARAVFALVEPRPGPHLHAGEPMAVAAVAAALTVALTFDGLVVPDRDVVSVRVLAEWARADRGVAVNAVPAVFGLTESAVRLLDAAGRDRDEPAAVEAARRLGERLVAVRGEAYRLLDDVPPDEAVAQRLGLRAAAGRLAVEATTALVVAGAGAAMATASPAQRKAREALFLLVQAQTREARTAALRLWGR
jgi:alkylation response protein AidB-like acyl-CoA dehydrogenase